MGSPLKKDDGSSRKRKLEMPSVRSKMTCSPTERAETPSMSAYFPASMVGHSLYDVSRYGSESPADDDDGSDCGNYDPNIPQR